MNERVREIISWIIHNEHGDTPDLDVLFAMLEDLGYSPDEIEQALDLLEIDSLLVGESAESGFVIRSRVLGDMERGTLQLDAQAWLLWMHGTGRMTETQLNYVIESAGFECRAPATLMEVMNIASRYVPVRRDVSGGHAGADTLN